MLEINVKCNYCSVLVGNNFFCDGPVLCLKCWNIVKAMNYAENTGLFSNKASKVNTTKNKLKTPLIQSKKVVNTGFKGTRNVFHCKSCGIFLNKESRNTGFCSTNCARKLGVMNIGFTLKENVKNVVKPKKTEKKCKNCQKPFVPYHYSDVYCSKACSRNQEKKNSL